LGPKLLTMGDSTRVIPERYGLNFGEAVGSLRNILHRAMVTETVSLNSVTASSMANITKSYKRMPNVPGYQPGTYPLAANKIVAASGTANYAFGTMTHVPYITGMFLGYRGSVNYIVTPSTDLSGDVADMRVIRSCYSNSFNQNSRYYINGTSVTFAATASARANNLNRVNGLEDGLAGMAITATNTNNTLS
jgi:hypothetical protein